MLCYRAARFNLLNVQRRGQFIFDFTLIVIAWVELAGSSAESPMIKEETHEHSLQA